MQIFIIQIIHTVAMRVMQPEVNWALETNMDELAELVGMIRLNSDDQLNKSTKQHYGSMLLHAHLTVYGS